MPVCQLQSIQIMVNSLYPAGESIPFWIDTLSVPRDPKLRRVAIENMHNVYRHADKVLVLDTFLRLASITGGPEDAMQRIKVPDWTKRLWTLPEGAHAKEIYFQFAERSISDIQLVQWYQRTRNETGWVSELKARGHGPLDEFGDVSVSSADVEAETEPPQRLGASTCLIEQWRNFQDISFSGANEIPPLRTFSGTQIFKSAFYTYQEIRDGLFESSIEGVIIKKIIDAIRWRNTSRIEDETLCLAQILQIDPAALLAAEAPERMRILLSHFTSIPSDIIFGNHDRYSEYGSRWMPKTLLSAGFESKGTSRQLAQQSSLGLLVKLPGARLHPLPASRNIPGANIYLEDAADADVRYQVLLRDDRSRSWTGHHSQDKVIILEKHAGEGKEKHAVSGILATVMTEVDGAIHVQIEASLSFGLAIDADREQDIWGKLDMLIERLWCCG